MSYSLQQDPPLSLSTVYHKSTQTCYDRIVLELHVSGPEQFTPIQFTSLCRNTYAPALPKHLCSLATCLYCSTSLLLYCMTTASASGSGGDKTAAERLSRQPLPLCDVLPRLTQAAEPPSAGSVVLFSASAGAPADAPSAASTAAASASSAP